MDIYDVFQMLGGIGLFLVGMHIMSEGLKNSCGDNLQSILGYATKNKVIAVLAGMGMTMLIQSSSATDVMVIGFVNSGLMNISQAIGVIMGANIGTTITAQITAFDISAFTPLMMFVGGVMYLFFKKAIVKHVGSVIMGFGMLFTGITIVKSAIKPLAATPEFISFMKSLDEPLIAVLFGVGFTALLQSSSSSTVIFQAFAVQGILQYDTAVYLVIGAAIGSVTPNLLASLTANREGKRTAILNLIFNLMRAALVIVLINIFPIIPQWIQNLSPGDVGRQIANTHTIFAIVAVLVWLPFTEFIIKLAKKVVPVSAKETDIQKERTLVFMTQMSKMPATMALQQARREVGRMGKYAIKNLEQAMDCFFDYSPMKAQSVYETEETVNILNHSIADAMTQLRAGDLSVEDMRKVSMLAITIADIERLSDHAVNIVEHIETLNRKKVSFSEDSIKELKEMSADALEAVRLSIEIFETDDTYKLEKMEELEQKVDDHENRLVNNYVSRMTTETSPLGSIIFSDIVTGLERCSDHAINIAYALQENFVETDD